jgi:hypothetical protein
MPVFFGKEINEKTRLFYIRIEMQRVRIHTFILWLRDLGGNTGPVELLDKLNRKPVKHVHQRYYGPLNGYYNNNIKKTDKQPV